MGDRFAVARALVLDYLREVSLAIHTELAHHQHHKGRRAVLHEGHQIISCYLRPWDWHSHIQGYASSVTGPAAPPFPRPYEILLYSNLA